MIVGMTTTNIRRPRRSFTHHLKTNWRKIEGTTINGFRCSLICLTRCRKWTTRQTYDRLHRFAVAFEYLVIEIASFEYFHQDKFNKTRIYNRLVIRKTNPLYSAFI